MHDFLSHWIQCVNTGSASDCGAERPNMVNQDLHHFGMQEAEKKLGGRSAMRSLGYLNHPAFPGGCFA